MPTTEEIDLSEFEAKKPPRNGKPCWFTQLNDEQQQKATKAKSAGYSADTIARVVTGWGVPVKLNVIYGHFRGTCSCA